jgi:hypothetical protein
MQLGMTTKTGNAGIGVHARDIVVTHGQSGNRTLIDTGAAACA